MEEISKDLLEILVCPKCKTAIKQAGNYLQCQSPDCGLRYPIRDGIPIMLIESAEPPTRSDETA